VVNRAEDYSRVSLWWSLRRVQAQCTWAKMNVPGKDYIWAIVPGPLTIKGIGGKSMEYGGCRSAIWGMQAVAAFDGNRVEPGFK
jgi:hypothetical protein